MKIAIISNSPTRGTGFGQQTKLLAQGFTDRGHSVTIICEPHLTKNEFPWEEIKTEAYDSSGIDRVLSEVRPDAAIFFDSAQRINEWMNIKVAAANIPLYYWYPYEGSSVPDDYLDMFYGIRPGALVHLSYFSKSLWERSDSDRVIYHAVNPAFRKLTVSKRELRRKWSRIFKAPIFSDAPLVINVNRNFWHKGWDLCFDYIRQMKEVNPEIQLLAHTVARVDEARGGFDLPKIARIYGIEENVIFSGFDWKRPLDVEELNEIINMADWRVDTSHGEGWGLTIAECAAAGLPQILTNHTTMKEIVGSDYPGLIEPASTRFSVGTSWKVPNIPKYVELSKELLESPDKSRFSRDEVSDQFSVDNLITAWEEVIQQDLPIDLWDERRYGYRKQHVLRGSKQSLARIAQVLKASIFEIGAYDGELIDWATQFGVKISAISDRLTGDEKKDRHIQVRGYDTAWNPADILVFTDEQDSFLASPLHVFDRFGGYPWLMIRLQDRFKWGDERIPADQFRSMIAERGHSRRGDIELIVKKKLPFFDYEIWSLNEEMPEAILSF